jgi:hypothetical protein
VWVWVRVHLCLRVRCERARFVDLLPARRLLSPLFALLVGRCCLCGMNAQLSQGFSGA